VTDRIVTPVAYLYKWKWCYGLSIWKVWIWEENYAQNVQMFGTGQVGQHLHNQRLNLLSQRLLLILIVDMEPGKHDPTAAPSTSGSTAETTAAAFMAKSTAAAAAANARTTTAADDPSA